MRYGSSRQYDEDDLGKYGLGLKTASLSQCRQLTVATRRAASSRLQARQWDLDRVERNDAWELVRPDLADCRPIVDAFESGELKDHRGTTVLWEKLDRLSAYRSPDGRTAENGLIRLCEDVEEH